MEEIKAFLQKLGFIENNNIFEKKYNDYPIKIDIKKGKIYYRDDDKTTEERIKDGKIQLGDTTSSHFKPKGDVNQEAFVVLFAIDRLLTLGYNPDDLHLERKWKVGRGASGGKADINVYKEDKTYIIIECKRYDEYEKEKKRMLNNGGQLFSYLNQDKNGKYLALFTSKFEEDEIFYENAIVKIIDNPQKVKECEEKQNELCSYKDANNKDEFFYIWKNLYNSYFYRYGIFENDATPYNIELKPLKKKDLIPFNTSKGLFNKFAEILRHNNISDNANAFNKMLSLILSKIVDEEKQDNEILDFQVIEGISDEKLVDKLQGLYKIGVEKYLGIDDFVYHSDEEIKERIEMFPERKPLEEILQFFKEIKYYTDKTFAFKEIYNKKLFEENAVILKEVVEILQHYKFKNANKNQFLGDFFELLLNHGVKQSEGQFFTPLPIARFMVLSLNLKSLHKQKQNSKYPLLKTLDFACGAGHFLIEAIDEIEKINKQTLNLDINEWTKEHIFGIEKDYRLARTAKIACFLNGDGEANIIYGDGLKKHETLKEDIEKFDLIITNPPYSVKEFKNYVELNKDEFELFDYLSEKASEIEVLFIERAKQALKENARAAIILPSSILTNSGIYTKARELILKYFDIVAITELGSKTFIATGTNTVILFLKRKKEWYQKDFKKITDEIFDNFEFFENDYLNSKQIFEEFIKFREITDLDKFIELKELNEEFLENEKIKEYKKAFDNLSEIKNLKKKKFFKELSEEEKEEELKKRFIEYLIEKEKEKFYYFALSYNQKVVIVKSPSDTKAQKEFLGYEFNKKRGFEGIEIYTDENGKPTTKLYDETDNPKKANYYIKQAFDGVYKEVEVDFVKYLNLVDMLDFDSVNFEKVINTNVSEKLKIESGKWEMVKLGEMVETIGGLWKGEKPPFQKAYVIRNTNFDKNNKLDLSDIAYLDVEIKAFEKRKLQKGDIILEKSGGSATQSVGRILYFDLENNNYTFSNFMVRLRIKNKNLLSKYLYYFLEYLYNQNYILSMQNGMGNIKNLDMKQYLKIPIPLPPLDIQQKIVKEIEEVEKKSEKLKKENEEFKKEIENIIQMESGKWRMENLGNIGEIASGGTPSRKIKEYWNGNINWIRSEVCQNNYVYEYQVKEKITELGLKKSNTKIFKKDTILIALVGATLGKVGYLTFESATNQNIAGIYNLKNMFPKMLFYILKNSKELQEYGKGSFKMLSITKLKNFKIPLPPLDIQKEIISKIENLEDKINNNKETIERLKKQKEEILQRHIF